MTALQTVRKAARARAQADRKYREALAAARAAGHSYRQIGDAAGLTYQAVHDYLKRKDGKP